MNLVLSYRRSRDEAEQTVADIEAARCHTAIVSGYVLSPADALTNSCTLRDDIGPIDVLVNTDSTN
ncbi:MAG TPA: hypothetical protein VE422_35690 [Terriglobia bacterium]|nr:hypothetical protein [Terriglobia bacterium]